MTTPNTGNTQLQPPYTTLEASTPSSGSPVVSVTITDTNNLFPASDCIAVANQTVWTYTANNCAISVVTTPVTQAYPDNILAPNYADCFLATPIFSEYSIVSPQYGVTPGTYYNVFSLVYGSTAIDVTQRVTFYNALNQEVSHVDFFYVTTGNFVLLDNPFTVPPGARSASVSLLCTDGEAFYFNSMGLIPNPGNITIPYTPSAPYPITMTVESANNPNTYAPIAGSPFTITHQGQIVTYADTSQTVGTTVFYQASTTGSSGTIFSPVTTSSIDVPFSTFAVGSLGAMRTNLRIRLDELTASFWSDAELNNWINEGAQDIARQTESLLQIKTIPAIPGQRAYLLPMDTIRVHKAEFMALGGYPVWPMSFRPYAEMTAIWGNNPNYPSSIPAYFTVWGNPPDLMLYVWPIIQLEGELHIYYYRLPQRAYSDSDFLDTPAGYLDLVTDYAEYNALRKARDPRWTDAMQLYSSKLEVLMRNSRSYTDLPNTVGPEFGNMTDMGFWGGGW